MTRYVVDATALLHMAEHGLTVREGSELLAPTLIRSQVLSILHEAVHDGELTVEEARKRLDRAFGYKMRLLGDAVLRKVAWELADQLGWRSTYQTEYLALTRLQADAFVTLDQDLAARVADVVETRPLDEVCSQ